MQKVISKSSLAEAIFFFNFKNFRNLLKFISKCHKLLKSNTFILNICAWAKVTKKDRAAKMNTLRFQCRILHVSRIALGKNCSDFGSLCIG